jgi:hypothetical protein
VSPAPTCDSAGAVGDRKGERMHQDELVALLGALARGAYPPHAGDARSSSGGVCVGVRADVDVDADVGAGVGACDCANASGCVRGYDCEYVNSQPSLEVVAVAAAALASLQGESGDGRESVVDVGEGENEGENECGGKNCRACVHMTAVHVGGAPRDR